MTRTSEGVSTTLNSTTRLIRMVGNQMQITECYFEMNLDLVGGADKAKQVTAITRIKIWLDHMLNDCIVVPMNREIPVDLSLIHI